MVSPTKNGMITGGGRVGRGSRGGERLRWSVTFFIIFFFFFF